MTKLKELRIKNGYTQIEISKLLDITQSTYSYHENGISVLNADQIKLLAALYNISTDELLEMNNEDNFRRIQNKLAEKLSEKIRKGGEKK